MTLVRVTLLSSEAKAMVKVSGDGRTLKLEGPDHVTFELNRVGDTATIMLVSAAPDVKVHTHVPENRPEFDMKPVPESVMAGVYEVVDGTPFYRGMPSKGSYRK